MKRIIFTILLSVLMLPSFAQNCSFYVDGMKWVTGEFYFNGGNISVGDYLYFSYTIDGDTTINGYQYKRMKQLAVYPEKGSEYYYDTYFVRYDNGKHLFYLPDYKEYADYGCYIGDDCMFFDENLKEGDLLPFAEDIIYSLGDTVFVDSPNNVRKYWKTQHYSDDSRFSALNDVMWIDGVGSLSQPIPYFIGAYDCACYQMLFYCINPEGDTICRNQKYIDLFDFKTDVRKISASEISFTQQGNECIVTLPADVAAWEATLSNSVGVTVARCSREGSEIILPATSKGTHILMIKADGRVVKKKVFIK